VGSAVDVVVIGSGFGGGVAASRLVESGARVTVLERGPWRDTVPIREAGIGGRAPLPAGAHFARYAVRGLAGAAGACRLNARGLYDIHCEHDLTVVCASGVGGGSHVYTAMLTPPAREDYWDGHDERLTSAGMAEHYAWFAQRFPSRPIEPADEVPNWPPVHPEDLAFFDTEGVEQPPIGFRYELHSHRNSVFTGSADGAKRTVDAELLVPALDRGLTVRPLQEVVHIAADGRGYRLRVRDHESRSYRYLRCTRVVLAAGALNTLRLLMGSRAAGGLSGMPALGEGMGGNGDVLGWWAQHRDGVDYTQGAPSHGRIRLRGMDRDPFMMRCGVNGVDDIPLPAQIRDYLRHNALLVGMGVDRGVATAQWRSGRLRIRYDHRADPVLREIADAFDGLGRDSGHRVWQLPRGRGFTVHLHGGARTGAGPETSVVDWRGEVHDHPGLYVADAAALPEAVGTPPSLTIAAWAGHVARQLVHPAPTTHAHRTPATARVADA
jgi:cholesterol oxidase